MPWCKTNNISHTRPHAAPGGQGNDPNIADRDESKPSLRASSANQQKMVAVWKKLAERYAGEQ